MNRLNKKVYKKIVIQIFDIFCAFTDQGTDNIFFSTRLKNQIVL